MVSKIKKIQNFVQESRLPLVYKSVPSTEKRPWRPKNGISKMALMKRDHLFRSSLGPGSPVWKKWLKTGRSKTALKEPSCFPSIARLPPGSLRSRLPQRWSQWSQAISDVASLPEIFPLERPKKSCSIYFLTGFSGNFLQMVNNH